MTTAPLSNAEQELKYIKKNAYLSLALAICFFLKGVGSVVTFEIHALNLIGGFAILATTIVMLYFLVSSLSNLPNTAKKSFWTGVFEDEYVNQLNLKGYKWAFVTSCITLFPFMLFDVSRHYEITTKDFATIVMSALFFGYSLPVLHGLRQDNE